MSKISNVGIHLGTTYCSLAYVDDSGDVQLARLEDGRSEMPCVMVRHRGTAWYTGYNAKHLALRYDPDAYDVIECPCCLLGDDEIQLGDETFLPEEIVAVLLRTLIERAAPETGPIEAAALTFSPSMSPDAMAGVGRAAELAGLKVTALVPGPIASVAGVIPDDDSHGRWLVYHLGHLSFDATIVQRKSPLAMTTHRVTSVGGRDWTVALAEIVAERIWNLEDVDIRQDPVAMRHLLEQSEQAKIQLNVHHEARVQAIFEDEYGDRHKQSETVTREEFEESTRGLVEQTMRCMQETLRQHDIPWGELSGTVAAGKSTHMPMIQRRLREETGDENVQHAKDPAIGAATVALGKASETGSESGTPSRSEMRSADVVDQKQPALEDGYRFAAFYSEQLGVGHVGSLIAYAYWPTVDARAITEEAAARIQRPAGAKITAGVPMETGFVARDQEIIVTIDVDGLEFESREARLKLWSDMQSAEFRFRCPASAAGRTLQGFVNYWLGRILIAMIPVRFVVAVDDLPVEFREALAEVNATPYRKVFPSYSHDDKEIVDQIELYTDAFGDTYLRDVKKLRTGEAWNPKILRFIQEADVFQLFWSPHSAESEYVTQERVEAMRVRKLRGDPYFVRPVYWAEKPIPDPPRELDHIHFAKLPIE